MARKNRNKPTTAKEGRDKVKVDGLVAWAERMMFVVGTVLVLLFGWLQFSKEDIELFASEPAAELILRAAMVVYLASWSAGVVHDVRDQGDAFLVPAHDGKKTWTGIGIILVLVAMFGLMCYLRTRPQYFPYALAGFLAVNIGGWHYYNKQYMEPMIEKSRAKALSEPDYFAVEKIANVEEYTLGDWQYHRFAIGVALVVVIGILLYPGNSQRVADLIPGTTPHEIQSLLVLAFVFIMEGVIWYRRIRERMGRTQLDALKIEYTLFKRQ